MREFFFDYLLMGAIAVGIGIITYVIVLVGENNGLIVYTDYATGVQYISAPHGGFFPRIDRNGHIMTIGEGANR